jgi:hypothetical protein
MPALPWTQRQEIEPDRDYVVMASRLPLTRYRSIPGFLRDVMVIRRQLARTAGLVGYGLNAQLTRKTFWTFSVWDDRRSLDDFGGSDPHLTIIRRLAPRMDQTTFRFLSSRGDGLPLDWDRITDLLTTSRH